jgi:hypothetical protein
MATKKKFTTSDGAIEKLFTQHTLSGAANAPKAIIPAPEEALAESPPEAIVESPAEAVAVSPPETLVVVPEEALMEEPAAALVETPTKMTSETTSNTIDNPPEQCAPTEAQRGRRIKRFSLLIDQKLKDDLFLLAKATGSRSVNNFITTALINFVETEENQEKLARYKEFLK